MKGPSRLGPIEAAILTWIRKWNEPPQRRLSASVPLYYFSFRDSGELQDDMGMELVDEQAACSQAIRGARSIIADLAGKGRLPLSARVQVEDESRRFLFALSFKDTVKIE